MVNCVGIVVRRTMIRNTTVTLSLNQNRSSSDPNLVHDLSTIIYNASKKNAESHKTSQFDDTKPTTPTTTSKWCDIIYILDYKIELCSTIRIVESAWSNPIPSGDWEYGNCFINWKIGLWCWMGGWVFKIQTKLISFSVAPVYLDWLFGILWLTKYHDLVRNEISL